MKLRGAVWRPRCKGTWTSRGVCVGGRDVFVWGTCQQSRGMPVGSELRYAPRRLICKSPAEAAGSIQREVV
eukprot:1909833-Rhodomonas_salina.1